MLLTNYVSNIVIDLFKCYILNSLEWKFIYIGFFKIFVCVQKGFLFFCAFAKLLLDSLIHCRLWTFLSLPILIPDLFEVLFLLQDVLDVFFFRLDFVLLVFVFILLFCTRSRVSVVAGKTRCV